MSQRKRTLKYWWRRFLIVTASGAAFFIIMALRWDLMAKLAGAEKPAQYSGKDVLECEKGTHQLGGACISNPDRPGSQSPTPPVSPQSPVSTTAPKPAAK
jgi:hypothetical protein